MQLNNKERIVLIVGKSGAGKGTVIKALTKMYPAVFRKLVSSTSREIREGEVDGVDYNFDTYENILNEDKVECDFYDNNVYALTENELRLTFDLGFVVGISEFTLDGVEQVEEMYPNNTISIYLDVDDDVAENRLRSRGGNPDEVSRRIKLNKDMDYEYIKSRCNYIVSNNDDLEYTVQEVLGVINDDVAMY